MLKLLPFLILPTALVFAYRVHRAGGLAPWKQPYSPGLEARALMGTFAAVVVIKTFFFTQLGVGEQTLASLPPVLLCFMAWRGGRNWSMAYSSFIIFAGVAAAWAGDTMRSFAPEVSIRYWCIGTAFILAGLRVAFLAVVTRVNNELSSESQP